MTHTAILAAIRKQKTAKRKLEHAIAYLRPLAQGDTMKGIGPNAEALAISTLAGAEVSLIVDMSNTRIGLRRYLNAFPEEEIAQ